MYSNGTLKYNLTTDIINYDDFVYPSFKHTQELQLGKILHVTVVLLEKKSVLLDIRGIS